MNIVEVFRLLEEHPHRQNVAKARALIDQVLRLPALSPQFRPHIHLDQADCFIEQNHLADACRTLSRHGSSCPLSIGWV